MKLGIFKCDVVHTHRESEREPTHFDSPGARKYSLFCFELVSWHKFQS